MNRAVLRLALRGICFVLVAPALAPLVVRAEDEPVSFELSEATASTKPSPPVSSPPERRLSPEDTARLLSRLPKPKPEVHRIPAPKPKLSGPPPASAQSASAALQGVDDLAPSPVPQPLRILRQAPVGEVSLAPNLSVAFSEAMVPLASDEDLAREAVPVRLTPEPPGRWRWQDTHTLLFTPDGRFPMATLYLVEVTRGTQSLAGNALEDSFRWTFTTTTPKVTTWHPKNGPTSDRPLVFIRFDQRVDPEHVLGHLRVSAGEHAWSMRLATGRELEADGEVKRLAGDSLAGRWLALCPSTPFPAGSTVKLRLEAGLGSAEGTLTTSAEQEHRFVVRSELKLVKTEDWGGDGWAHLEFSNPIDAEAFDQSLLRVSPPIEGFEAHVSSNRIVLGGTPRRPHKYRVRIARTLRDVFGQNLGRDVSTTMGTRKPWEWDGLWLARSPLAVADPKHPSISVFSKGVSSFRLRAYAVEPAAWDDFRKLLDEYHPGRLDKDGLDPLAALGRLVLEDTVAVSPVRDTPVETRVDLSSCLDQRHGQLIVKVEGTSPGKLSAPRLSIDLARAARVPLWFDLAWVQATQIGLEAAADGDSLQVSTTSLADGRPLADVEIEAVPTGERARTDASGRMRLPLHEQAVEMIIARTSNEVAFLPLHRYEGSWKEQPRDPLRWYVVDDRGLYRPGEEVRIKGYLRQSNKQGALLPLDANTVSAIEYVLEDSRENELIKGRCEINRFGAFDLALTLPQVMALGDASLRLDASGGSGSGSYVHTLRVEEFRRPEYEIDLRLEGGPFVAGDSILTTALAKYYTGAGLPGAKATWDVGLDSGSGTHFTPEGWTDYSFFSGQSLEAENRKLDGVTNADGEHTLRIATRGVGARVARALWVSVAVTDVNGQSWGRRAWATIVPAAALVGVKTERGTLPSGNTIEIDVAVVDPRGAPVAGRPVVVNVERTEWRQVRGHWSWQSLGTQSRELTSAASPVRLSIRPEAPGRHVIRATVTDSEGREHTSETTLWAGGAGVPRGNRTPGEASLTLDKEVYAAGERAQIIVSSPFVPARGLLTLTRGALVHSEPFVMNDVSHTIVLPIDEAWMPGGDLRVDLRSADGRGSGPAPHHPLSQSALKASATAWLDISRASRRLTLSIVPHPADLAPGGETSLSLDVRDNAGQPVAAAEIAVWAVDEAVLGLFPRSLEHPVDVLNPTEHSWISRASLLDALDLASDELLTLTAKRTTETLLMFSRLAPGALRTWRTVLNSSAGQSSMVMGGALALRQSFSPLGFFVPSVVTDARGRAFVKVRVPDNLTRYRVFGLVTDGKLLGGASSEATLTARLPLMARPSPPRFLNQGDEFELPVVVQNDTDAATQADVALRAVRLRLADGAGRSVAVPPHGRAEVRFPLTAEHAGEATLTVVATASTFGDSAELKLPVKVPARIEDAAVYGQLDGDGALRQVVQAPADALTDLGGVDVTLSSTGLQALSRAVLDLATYEYECAEQISSRVLSIAVLGDVLTAFRVPGLPPTEKLTSRVQKDIQSLSQLQNDDGGFGFWRRGELSWPYVTIHVTHALARAREKGFVVSPSVLAGATGYLEKVEEHTPKTYPDEARHALRAYAIYVRHLLDADATQDARALLNAVGVDRLSLESLGWLLPALASDGQAPDEVAAIRALLNNRVIETAASAHFVSAYRESAHLLLQSDRRTDAVLLDALIQLDPKDGLIPKLASGLLDAVKHNRWLTTQDESFILIALDRYFQTYEKSAPDFVARLWWGRASGGQRRFRGHTFESESLTLPMAQLADQGGTLPVTISKNGVGRLYYRVGLKHASSKIDVPASDNGLRVARRYVAVDNRNDVRRLADGRWRFRAGARVRVEVTLVAPAVRHHVALVDPLPAGLEPLNPILAMNDVQTHGRGPSNEDDEDDEDDDDEAESEERLGGSSWLWFAHHELRDDRAEVFATSLRAGVYRFEYLARATTKGRFVAPAPKAEEMYAPETYGRGVVERIIVE